MCFWNEYIKAISANQVARKSFRNEYIRATIAILNLFIVISVYCVSPVEGYIWCISLRMEEHTCSEKDIVPFICLILFLSEYQQLRAHRLQGRPWMRSWISWRDHFGAYHALIFNYLYFYIFHKFSFLFYNLINWSIYEHTAELTACSWSYTQRWHNEREWK